MENTPRIVDMRYSLSPNEVDPMWGIDLSLNKGDRGWWSSRRLDERPSRVCAMVFGLGGVPLDDNKERIRD